LISVLVFLAFTRNWPEIRRLKVGWGLLLWAAVMLCWLVPAGLSGGREYLEPLLVKQNVTRYANPWHHFQPWYYYLTVIPIEFFPWSLLLPTAIVVGWRRLSGRARQGFLFALCWMVATVLFFSLSPGKRTVYILTMYPAMALLIGAALDRLAAEWPRERRWLLWPLGLAGGLSTLFLIALPLLGRGRPDALPLGGDRLFWMVMAIVAPAVCGAAAAWWIALSGRVSRATIALAAGMALTGISAALFLWPHFDTVKSARELSAFLSARMGPDEPYGIYPRLDPTFLFYTQRFAVDLNSEGKLRDFLRRPGRIWLLIQRDDLKRLEKPLPPLREVTRDVEIGEGYILFTRP
jgi:4-amino-4-deoxy-L-arabinose transferase-like glycosyltransferase